MRIGLSFTACIFSETDGLLENQLSGQSLQSSRAEVRAMMASRGRAVTVLFGTLNQKTTRDTKTVFPVRWS